MMLGYGRFHRPDRLSSAPRRGETLTYIPVCCALATVATLRICFRTVGVRDKIADTEFGVECATYGQRGRIELAKCSADADDQGCAPKQYVSYNEYGSNNLIHKRIYISNCRKRLLYC